MFRRDVCSHKHCEAVLSPKHHTLGLSKHLKKTNSGLKRNSRSLTKLPGLWAYGLHAKICQGISRRGKERISRDPEACASRRWRWQDLQSVSSVQKGKFSGLGFASPLLPPPPHAVCLGAYGKHQREVENMASQAKGKNAQVRTFLFTGHGVLCHCFSFPRESGSTLCRSLFIGREED